MSANTCPRVRSGLHVGFFALTVAIAMAPPTVAAAQTVGGILADYSTTSWTEKDGLPTSRILAISQTADEYLWLGTDVGLVRFDGAQFLLWKEFSDVHLPDRPVLTLCTANDGSLWIGFISPGGVSRIQGGLVTNYDERDGLTGGSVTSVIEGRDKTIWASTHDGLFRFRSGTWTRIGPESGLAEGTVSSTFEDSRSNLWVSTSDGVFRRLKDQQQFERVVPASYWAHRVTEDRTGAIWITDPRVGLRRVLTHVDSSAPSLSSLPVALRTADGLGIQILPDRYNSLWIATLGRGLWRVRTSEGHSDIDTSTINTGLLSNSVRAIFEDHKGNLWVGTDNGLQQLSRKTLTGLTGLGLVRVVENGSDGSVWVGTTSGLVRFKDGRQVRYGLHGELPSPFVTALHSDHTGGLWIATDRGVTQFKDDRFIPVGVPITHRITRVYSMTTDSQGGLWLCDSNQGLFRWAGRTLTPFDVPSQLDHRNVTSVHGDAADRVWILRSAGGFGVVERDGSFRDVNSTGITFSTLHQDSGDNVMWVGGLQGAGRISDNHLVTVGEKNGLPTASVNAIVPGDDGHVWLGTPVGIVRMAATAFDTVDRDASAKVNYTLYNTEDGMAGSPVGLGVPGAVRAADSRLWFVTTNGVSIVDPRSIRDGATIPPVHIAGVVADARRLRPTRHLSLAPLTSTIEIEYSAVTFSSPKKVRYRYRLDGFDRDWREVGTRREALYTNLPPGQYRFRVAAANNENGFGVDGASIDFTILPTFYQTGWFYTACALTLILVVWVVWKLRVGYLHREFSLVLGERVRVSREIHDTLLQSLVGVALQLDALSESAGPLDSMKATLATTRREVEDYIRETRRSIWNLRSPKLERGDLAAALRHAGDRMTSGTPVQFTLTAIGQTRRLEADVEQQLLRIGEQAMLNSVRHANATEVHLKLQYEEDAVLLRVSDNGRGFDATEPAGDLSQHYGLMGMKERTEQAGGGLNIVTHPGGGTAVEIVIPVTSNGK